jgi:predicted phage terminase large subunit-like protein
MISLPPNNLPPLSLAEKDIEKLFGDITFRREQAKTFLGFCLTYLPHYFNLPPASFHIEFMKEAANPAVQFLEICAFRGSSKSTICSLALPLWLALEYPKDWPFIVLISDATLTGLHASAFKYEVEHNGLIQNDYGQLQNKESKWAEGDLVIPTGVRILHLSKGQQIRGLKHKQHRPSLIVADDIEGTWKDVRTKEARDTNEQYFTGEILPALETKNGRCVLIGNWLHNDGLMARIEKRGSFKVLKYPLLENGEATWKAKFPTKASVVRLEKSVPHAVWLREYQLKAVAEDGQEVLEDWIRYYDEPPPPETVSAKGTGVDLAISKHQSADYTAMVSGRLVMEGDAPRIYIDPYPVKAHYTMAETVSQAKVLQMGGDGFSHLFVEDVAYQKAAIEEMIRQGLNAVPMRAGTDKRARLRSIALYIQNGTVVFPRKGCEDLLEEILGFGVEEHDDLVDAFGYLILGLLKEGIFNPELIEVC